MSTSTTAAKRKRSVRRPFLFEIAWEVANKVGGIYTVIKTKVPVTVDEYGHDRYCLIGPLSYKTAPLEVEAMVPADPDIREAIAEMTRQGVKVLFGRWLIESAPLVLLFDVGSVYHRLNEWKANLWEQTGIPTHMDDSEMNESIIFGYLVSWFLGEFAHRNQRNAIIAHFHEWLAGVGLVLAKKRQIDICTIFTTHATLLGRYLCAGSVDFYNSLHSFDVDYEAGKRGIYHRYCLERAAAHSADVFTTVSHITAYEAENLLKRKPDGVVPNGLSVVKFSAMHEFQNLHAQYKAKIHDFVRGHFYGHYDFDLDNTLYFFTAGRYEYRNKGVDMYIEALERLNHRMKQLNSPMTVVAFIIMPAPTSTFSVDSLKGQAVMKQLRETVSDVQNNIGKRIFEACARGNLPHKTDILTDEEIVLLKRRIYSLKRDTLPPVVTHNMVDDATDPILCQLRRLRMFNDRHDRVKIIFHPEFLNSNSPLFGLDYEEFVRGCHLGVFPSYYEPWGYTPAECTVMGVPSITTNLSGFGCYMEENIETPSDYGIFIVDRRMKSVEESIQQLADTMLGFCHKSRRQRINLRNRTERLSDLLDWKRMGLEYVRARHLAMSRVYPKSFKSTPQHFMGASPESTVFGGEGHSVDDEEDEGESDDAESEDDEGTTAASAADAFVSSTTTTIPADEWAEEHVLPLGAGTGAAGSTSTKIQKPFSAPGSPKIREMLEETEEDYREFVTGGGSTSGGDAMLSPSVMGVPSPERIQNAITRKLSHLVTKETAATGATRGSSPTGEHSIGGTE